MTFILSVVIATNKILREKFYRFYVGKVPAITQFLLNYVTINAISLENKNYCIQNFKLDTNGYFAYTTNGLSHTLFDIKFLEETEEGLLQVLKWFELIEKYCAANHLFFKEFVYLNKSSMFSFNPNSLALFNQEQLNFFFPPAIKKNLKLQKIYTLLNKVLQIKLIDVNEYFISSEIEKTIEDKSTFLDDENIEEKGLVLNLLDLIINCDNFDN